MIRQESHFGGSCLRALALTGAVLAAHGCSGSSTSDEGQAATVVIDAATSTGSDGISTPISQLPMIDATASAQLLGELLAQPTALGETTALQVRLPPPANQSLVGSLVRVIGDTSNPHVLFRSDALVQLGLLGKSPGPNFFTAFVTLSASELDTLQRNSQQIASGAFGQTTNESVLFSGRAAFARTVFPPVSSSTFTPGVPVPVNGCSVLPASTQQAWDQSLFLRSPAVVLDPARTWDPCTGAGTQGGVWTFAHLIREMANGSGKTPEDFVKDWLSLWLNNYTVNGDVVAARTQMFNQVIQPWATASGVVATLVTDATGVRSVNLTGPLNLNVAPYRLEAIVNRIDLGTTTHGGGGYGSVTGSPVTAGELRFIFGVVQPNPWGAGGTEATCGRKLFTTIFEYGVPGTGCQAVVSWAQKWTQLQTFSGFTPAYLTLLQSMTESVVLHGAAPTKGNQNAINQVRTNEVQLQFPQWELREFTLTNENPVAGTDVPANGELRTHTVALTPNEAAISPAGADPAVNAEVLGPVTAGLELPVTLPNHCESSFAVPFFLGGNPFRGGNALSGGVGANFWLANMAPATPNGICARHQFSLNTCHGCHRSDSGTTGLGGSTAFVHIDPLSSIPVTMSKFLTGGGPGMTFSVNDTQFAPPTAPPWQFADLDRRLKRLFQLSHCTSCIVIRPMTPALVTRMQTFGSVPADVSPADFPDLKIGSITDLATVQKVLDLRASVADVARNEPVDVIRSIDPSSH